MVTSIHPFADSKVTKFLQERLAQLADRKSERQVAAEAGFKSLNIVNMMKKGDSKVPLDRVAGLARALETDPTHLFILALDQYMPSDAPEMSIASTILSKNEKAIIDYIREVSGSSDPGLNDQRKEAIKKTFA
jgi:hypothetical protein